MEMETASITGVVLRLQQVSANVRCFVKLRLLNAAVSVNVAIQ